ncbi:hypothetical protein ILUMI_10595 [Ignelater luminosus]|uniref:Uncharacterized protein n=1 Tax=Ignelater luminosus TaxID=2038154 RepID=A0A8K0D6S1_IGNLU|nr:hypothetical protein ILUMI_10595 [Ignelater luminosus]
MNRWRQYFEKLTKSNERISEEGRKLNQEYEIDQVKEEELTDAIKGIKLGKAGETDNIKPEMIKVMGEDFYIL